MQFHTQLIELHMGEFQTPEQTLMQGLRMLASPAQPGPHRCFRDIEDPRGRTRTESLSDRVQDLRHYHRRGLEPVEWRVVARREFSPTPLTAKVLNE